MKKKSSSTVTAENTYQVHGTISDQHQQPVPNVNVHAYSKNMRGRSLLGKGLTDAAGQYNISYTPKNVAGLAVMVCVNDSDKTLLKESEVHNNVPLSLQVDIDVNCKTFAGISEYEQLVSAVNPIAEGIPLSELTETYEHRDISFIARQTEQPKNTIEKLAMAYRFEKLSTIVSAAWYGMLCTTIPVSAANPMAVNGLPADFESRLDATFDALMHTGVDTLVNGLQKAIEQNCIPVSFNTELKLIREKLEVLTLEYAKKHPVSGVPSLLYQQAQLAGLKGKELQSFIKTYNNHTGINEELWTSLRNNPGLVNDKQIDQFQAVFQLSRLTGNDLSLTEKLLKSEKIKSPADIKKLAKYDAGDWKALLPENGQQRNAIRKGKAGVADKKQAAAQLESIFTKVFPTAAFAARLEKDNKSKLAHKDKISKFLNDNEHFDLLHSRVGQFMKENKHSINEKDAPELEHHLRRTQRVFKLVPNYDAAHALLSDNIHSAHQVYKMGKDNFVRTYRDKLGEFEAGQVFEKASQVHASAVALAGDLQSMTEASSLNVFSNFSTSISQTLSQELPSLETLFGHTDFCGCDECRSVYGAPAYLTDILHFLDQRLSVLPVSGTKVPSVKDVLLRRRPDIGDIDLECNNTNTEVPYIDIACELMEDFIAPIKASIPASTYLSKLVKGPIDSTLLSGIKGQFTSQGQSDIGGLLTATAIVSDIYTTNHLQDDNTFITRNHWIIRDSQVSFKATTIDTFIEFRLLHQTLLTSEAISAGPEYINANVYSNFLKTAKRPFGLPFDLFETESDMYLQKLGVKKTDLINTFRKEDKLTAGSSPADLGSAYASLGINEAEQTLIFVADPTHQSLYWGSVAINTAIQVDVFEKLTGLYYPQITDLLQLKFINPLKDSVIEHDNLSADTTKQRITNITTTKLDAIHRFLRLWRKTTFTMVELDAIITAANIGGGLLTNKLAWQLQQFIWLQKKLQVSTFQLLAFYLNLDITHNLPDCLFNQMFQNSAVTTPISPNFSISAVTPATLGINPPDKAYIAAVLQISISDVDALILKTISRIAFSSLSLMYRYVQLARSLDISIADLSNLISLIDANPFLDLNSTYLFIQKYSLLLSSGFSIDDLNYVLRHQDNSSTTLVPSISQVSTALGQLQDEMLAVRTATQAAADANGVLLTKWLSDQGFKWDSNLLNKLVDMLNTVDDIEYQQKIDNNSNFLLNLRMLYHDPFITANLSALPLTTTTPAAPITFPASIASQLSFDVEKKQLRLVGYISQADKTALLALSSDTAYQAAINSIFTSAQQTNSSADNIFFSSVNDIVTNLKGLSFSSIANRFAFFINKLAPAYRNLQQHDALVKDISTWFNMDKKIVNQLLISVPGIYTDFTDDNFINKITAAPYPVQSSRYQFVAKICFITSKLKLTDVDLAFLIPHATDINSLNFLSLPLTPVATAATSFPGFETLINLLKFEQYYPAKIIDSIANTSISIYTILLDAINQGTLTPAQLAIYTANLVTNLVLLTGWNTADLNAFINTPNYITISLPGDIKSIPVLLRLHQRFVMLLQLGIPAVDAMISWNKASLTSADTAKIKQALKSRYSNGDWEAVATPLQNILREKKRDALIAYLLANPGTQTWDDTSDLYSYFLLDVEMCSCQPTSRIIQATNSVQLLVQRCFIGLEPSIKVDTKIDADWQQWQWMKNFRIWQANIKVFLYPENWIEPELLPGDIKSPFLKELEDDLLQGDVTADSVETAFYNYVGKLDNVARLEIKGMWYDENSRTLHVFGRTYGGDPKTYYYRQFIDNRRWTPWERIDLDINSDHIIPVVYNNRLYLFWAVITSQNKQTSTMMMSLPGTTPVPAPTPVLQWQIQLAFSEYNNGKWAHSKTSDNNDAGQLLCDQSLFPDRSRFFFTPLDIPLADYADLFVFGGVLNPVLVPKDGLAALYRKIKTAILKNGVLMVSCYYYDPTLPANINAHKYISSFKLDVVKGYPVRTNFSIPYGFDGSLFSSKIVLNQQNMIFVEPAAPPGSQPYSTPTPSQSRGRFNKLVPFQMGALSRKNYLEFLTEFTNFISTGFLLPYFYQDQNRTYYVIPEYTNNADFEFRYAEYAKFAVYDYLDAGGTYDQVTYAKLLATDVKVRDRFFNFFNPRMGDFMELLFLNGIEQAMSRDTQLLGDPVYDPTIKKFNFASFYSDLVATTTLYSGVSNSGYPIENVDFNQQSGYALYNWELFFHAPLMIAERLSQNHQFEAADRWYRYIFNPMDTSSHPSPDKYWNTKPFFINANDKYTRERIENILNGINTNDQDLIKDVTDWKNNPFQPHYIAQFRTVAYQKATIMKYVGHLIRHGDYLFSQHTMESVNEATQLYLLAAEILGPKPEVLASAGKTAVDNYSQLEQKLDSISNAVVDIENLLPLHSVTGYTNVTPQTAGLPSLHTSYFCIPMNENLAGPTGHWDTVTDRLFKIRHCLDIDGNLSPVSLFSAPIDPAILVRTAAAGLDIGTILNDLNAPMPAYRFVIMMQKAMELSNEIKTLGSLLLSVLEKKDTEGIALLRSGHEIKLLGSVLFLKQQQVQDAQAAIDSLDKQQELIVIRQQYYSGLLGKGLTIGEKKALDLNKRSRDITLPVQEKQKQSGLAAMLFPNFTFGQSGISSPVATFTVGGATISKYYEMQASMLSAVAANVDKEASMISTSNTYQRRAEEWQNQLNLANKELEQVQKQIEGAQIRLQMAQHDASNHQLQMDQAKATNEFMQSKFTNEELFNWMVTQVSTTYFRSYQLAYEVAKKAERCFRYELGLGDSAYINFGYWDSLKKGLLAGELLSYDIRKMEMAFYDQNKRELELTKPISLSQLDPVALLKLKTTGGCFINLPEELFDMDYPGHYMRRIKSLSVTIPCISGPYTTVSCKLTMTNNSVRTSGIAGDATQYPRKLSNGIPTDDPRFRDGVGSLQSIATSSAQNDSGLFELNFRDERYLPFEGAGTISQWRLELPAAIRQFDYNTISDVIIHMKYTARDGGDVLKVQAATSLNTKINQMLVSLSDRGLMRIFSAKNDLPAEWYKFLHPASPGDGQVLTVNLDKSRFPLFTQGKTIKIKSIELIADSNIAFAGNPLQVFPFPATSANAYVPMATGTYGSSLNVTIEYGTTKQDPGIWLIKNPIANHQFTESELNNMTIIVHYEVS